MKLKFEDEMDEIVRKTQADNLQECEDEARHGYRMLGIGVAEMVSGMVENGLSRQEAVILAGEYLHGVGSAEMPQTNT